MKDRIKKILRESDFGWTNDIEPFKLSSRWVMVMKSEEEFEEAQDYLFSQGFEFTWADRLKWDDGYNHNTQQIHYDGGIGGMSAGEFYLDGSGDKNFWTNEWEDDGYKVYFWSDLKKMGLTVD